MPPIVTGVGISPRVSAAITVAKSGVVPIKEPVRAAPMSFWLALRKVQPMKK
jgi:hypothetical protein